MEACCQIYKKTRDKLLTSFVMFGLPTGLLALMCVVFKTICGNLSGIGEGFLIALMIVPHRVCILIQSNPVGKRKTKRT